MLVRTAKRCTSAWPAYEKFFRSSGVSSFRFHRGYTFASSALMGPISKAFIARIDRFAAARGVPLIAFGKGQREDDLARAHLARFAGDDGVLFVGKAREKTPVVRTEKRRHPQTGRGYAWIVRSTAMVNHYDVDCVDRDVGPFFLTFCSYCPDTAALCPNGHEHLKRRVTRRTPGRFRTRVITDGVVPSLHVDDTSSRITQYHEDGRGLRTEAQCRLAAKLAA